MTVLVAREGAVCLITLDRPDKANALNREMSAALGEAFTEAAADDDIRVVVLAASGERHFCAGMDLAEFASNPAPPSERDRPALDVTAFTETRYPKPVIAAVNGAAVGGGFGIVLACDIVLASPNATFGIPEVRRGLVGVGVSSRAARRLPLPMVLRMALSGEPLDASTAQAASLVAEVVPQAELIPRALALAQQIATYSPEAVRAAKDVVLSAAESPDLDIASLRARAAAVTHGAAGRAGAAAFAAKTGGR